MYKVLIFSYYANLPGACQAEWIDDKLDAINKLNYKYSIITSPSADKINGAIKHYRVLSISFRDFQDEFGRCKQRNFSLAFLYFWLPVSFILGNLFDLIQFFVTKGLGEGRWSWGFTSLLFGFVSIIREGRPDIIFSTGGPASAHMSSVLLGRLFNRKVIIELQDPLSGSDIGRNERARGFLFKLEKFLANNVYKLVYVTKSAQNFAQKQFKTNNIFHIYPGSKPFLDKKLKFKNKISKKISLIHLGSLYSTRNFDTLLLAFDKLFQNKKLSPTNIEIINLGHVAHDIALKIQKYSFVKIYKPVNRLEALKIASSCDILLLIQNNDKRSSVTIPYKTYDYLNLSLPILGLTNSDEIDSMIVSNGCGVVAKVYEVEEISNKILQILKLTNEKSHVSSIDYIQQTKDLLNVG